MPPSEATDALRARIAETATSLFLRYGIRSTTMDTIADALRISKRTIYEHFDDKEALVVACVQRRLDLAREECQSALDRGDNAIEKLLTLLLVSLRQARQANPTFWLDIKGQYPSAWRLVETYRREERRDELVALLKGGIEAGLLRPELDCDIVAAVLRAQIDLLSDPDVFTAERYERSALGRHALLPFIRGLATDEGRTHLQTYADEKTLSL